MVPLVGRSRPTIIRAIVVFPEPDSPTMASDRPGQRLKETLSTAANSPNFLPSEAASKTGARPFSAIGCRLESAAQFVSADTAGHPAVEFGQPGHRGAADLTGMRAAGRECAFPGRCLER